MTFTGDHAPAGISATGVTDIAQAVADIGDGAAGVLAEAGLLSPFKVDRCSVLQWAASGAMWLTGHADGSPLAAPGGVAASLRRAADTIAALSADLGRGVELDVGNVLAARAGVLGWRRAGRRSLGGTSRLLPTRAGWLALTLARPGDEQLVAAALWERRAREPWSALADAARHASARELVERLQLAGLPAAVCGSRAEPGRAVAPFAIETVGAPADRRLDGVTVVDLSSLWAGPLCASILGRAGARVVKVESLGRPDGARRGARSFFDSLHSGHESVALDFSAPAGRRSLNRLVGRADVVIEASRPRALEQLGLSPQAFLEAAPGRTWVSITGYGRSGPDANRVAYGDDAAVAGGLVARDEEGAPVFCADAIADPISGLYAAAGVLGSIAAGGGQLVDVAMASAARHSSALPCALPAHPLERVGSRWWVCHGGERQEVVAPGVRTAAPTRARPLGADTARVLAEIHG